MLSQSKKVSNADVSYYGAIKEEDDENMEENGHTASSEESTLTIKSVFPSLFHCLLVVVLTGILATLQGSASQRGIVDGWRLSPTRCTLWVDGMCIPSLLAPTTATLGLSGELMEYEGRTTGLLSSMHPVFLCLSVAVLGLALTLKSNHNMADGSTSQIMKHIALVVLAVYAALYLFMQEKWQIPMNNVLLVECMYVLSLFFIGSAHNLDQEKIWLVNVLLTYPLLAVAALAGSGLDDSMVHLTVFFSLTLGALVVLVGSIEVDAHTNTGNVFLVLLVTFWLCLIPFGIQSVYRLQHMHDLLSPMPLWPTAALCLLLIMFTLCALVATLQLQYLGGLSSFSLSCLPPESFVGTHAFELLDLITKVTVTLAVTFGIYLDS